MPGILSDLSRQLAGQAERVCRHYLSNGRRSGRYWVCGDAGNEPGRSLWVRLIGPESGRGAAGRWVDAATGEHGDLLDLIRVNQGLTRARDLVAEVERFLAIAPRPEWNTRLPVRPGSSAAARRLWAASEPIRGTPAERYLRTRGIVEAGASTSLRFHPNCFYRPDARHDPILCRTAWPALIAAVRDGTGAITGLQRTWLSPDGCTKAPVATPRRAMGRLLGGGVRFGPPGPVIAIGEGIETVLSLREVMPAMPVVAALSAAHLAALVPPRGTRRLYLIRDNDDAGIRATGRLAARGHADGIDVRLLVPRLGDLNDDLRTLGRESIIADLQGQLSPEDTHLFSCAHSCDGKEA